MTQAELTFFTTKFGRPYFNHVMKYNKSLLARIYGVYTVKMEGLQEVHLMLMAHTLQIKDKHSIERVFDLKGST